MVLSSSGGAIGIRPPLAFSAGRPRLSLDPPQVVHSAPHVAQLGGMMLDMVDGSLHGLAGGVMPMREPTLMISLTRTMFSMAPCTRRSCASSSARSALSDSISQDIRLLSLSKFLPLMARRETIGARGWDPEPVTAAATFRLALRKVPEGVRVGCFSEPGPRSDSRKSPDAGIPRTSSIHLATTAGDASVLTGEERRRCGMESSLPGPVVARTSASVRGG